GVMRHADAGYETAIACAARNQLDLPMVLQDGNRSLQGALVSQAGSMLPETPATPMIKQ
ncbi:MAG: hypothetical protein JWR65_3925, partial [Massilia sp.]|nr:hypothetical protein [Massilia sp.]